MKIIQNVAFYPLLLVYYKMWEIEPKLPFFLLSLPLSSFFMIRGLPQAPSSHKKWVQREKKERKKERKKEGYYST